ncbi:hypothetical protein D3C81_1791200 [compost metagenome]
MQPPAHRQHQSRQHRDDESGKREQQHQRRNNDAPGGNTNVAAQAVAQHALAVVADQQRVRWQHAAFRAEQVTAERLQQLGIPG